MERLTVAEAARRLGVSPEAVRKRVKRGTIEHDRDQDGLTHVYVEVANPGPNPSPDTAGGQSTPHLERLLQNQEREIEHLRAQLEEANTRDRENRRIIAGLTQRIPELEASPANAQEAESVAESTGRGESPAEASEEPQAATTHGSGPSRSWWRRLLGR